MPCPTHLLWKYSFFHFHDATACCWPGPSHCRGFTITLRHTTVGRTPLDKWSDRRRDLYLTKHNTQQTNIRDPGGIRTHNPSQRVSSDPPLTPRGHWDRHGSFVTERKQCLFWILKTNEVLKIKNANELEFVEQTDWGLTIGRFISLEIFQWKQRRKQWIATTLRLPAELRTVTDKQKASNSQRFDGWHWLCYKRRGCSML